MKLVLVLLFVLAPAAVSQEPVPAAQDPRAQPVQQREAGLREGSATLMALEARMVESLFERRPWIARERGVRWEEPTLGRYGPASDSWWLDTLDSYRLELSRIEPAGLTATERLELDWLRAWTASELTLAYAVAPERWNPVTYIDRADSVLRSLAEPDTMDLPRRSQAVMGVLDELPDLWAAALRGLVAPVDVVSQDASARLVDLTVFMRLQLLQPFGEQLEDDVHERLKTRMKTALIEVEAFRQWLEDTRASIVQEAPTMGPEGWTKVLGLYLGEDVDVLDIKAKVLRAMFELDARAAPRRTATPSRAIDAETLSDEVTAAWRSTSTFCERSGLHEVFGERVKFEARPRKSFYVPGPVGMLRKGFGGGYKLDIESGGRRWTPEMRLTRQRMLEPNDARLLAVRFGHPGEAWIREQAFQSSSRAVRFLWNRVNIEGWGLYVADAFGRIQTKANPYAGPDFRAALARHLEIEAATFLAALEVHAEQYPHDDALESFQRRTGFDRLTVGHEIRSVLHDPLRGSGFLGYLRFMEVERRLSRKLELKPAKVLALMAEHIARTPFVPTQVLERSILSAHKR